MGCGASRVSPEQAEAEALLSAVDANGDGAISADELRAHMAKRGWPPEQADELFKRLDANADGQISRDELAEAMRRLQADAPT